MTLLDCRRAGLRAERDALWTAINSTLAASAVQGAMRPFYERAWAIEDELAGKKAEPTAENPYRTWMFAAQMSAINYAAANSYRPWSPYVQHCCPDFSTGLFGGMVGDI